MDTIDVTVIATRLKKAREHARPRLSQEAAAAKIGVSASTLQKWEQGVNSPPAVHLGALARLYGCTTDYLCGLQPDHTAGASVLRDLDLVEAMDAALAARDELALEDLLLWDPPMLRAWVTVPERCDVVSDVDAARERRRCVLALEDDFPELVDRWRRRFARP